MEEYELGMRLQTLANALILKIMGFEGSIVNHVKVQQMDEQYFRNIGDYEDVQEIRRKILLGDKV